MHLEDYELNSREKFTANYEFIQEDLKKLAINVEEEDLKGLVEEMQKDLKENYGRTYDRYKEDIAEAEAEQEEDEVDRNQDRKTWDDVVHERLKGYI